MTLGLGKLQALLRHNDAVLSRTVNSLKVDTSASRLKRPGLLRGEALARQMRKNRNVVASFIQWRARSRAESPDEVNCSLIAIAQLASLGILPGGILRKWRYRPDAGAVTDEVAPAKIPVMLSLLSERAFDLQSLKRRSEILSGIAAVEWELVVGPLHPFYDGCGRISRYFSTLLCLWNSVPTIKHSSREEYFEFARKGLSAFQEYFVAQAR